MIGGAQVHEIEPWPVETLAVEEHENDGRGGRDEERQRQEKRAPAEDPELAEYPHAEHEAEVSAGEGVEIEEKTRQEKRGEVAVAVKESQGEKGQWKGDPGVGEGDGIQVVAAQGVMMPRGDESGGDEAGPGIAEHGAAEGEDGRRRGEGGHEVQEDEGQRDVAAEGEGDYGVEEAGVVAQGGVDHVVARKEGGIGLVLEERDLNGLVAGPELVALAEDREEREEQADGQAQRQRHVVIGPDSEARRR